MASNNLTTSERKVTGKKSKGAGARFELKTRHDLEKKGWIVCKWANNVEFEGELCPNGKLIPAKTKWMFTKQGPRPAGLGSGFPDFVAFRKVMGYVTTNNTPCPYEVIAVESKMNGILSKDEKEKVEWLLENDVFEVILVASKGEKRGDILYEQILKGGKRKENEKIN